MATTTHSTERRFTPDRRANNVASVAAGHAATTRAGAASHQSTSHHSAKLSALGWAAMVLLIVGGVNWGLVGFFGFDLVAAIFGQMSVVSRIVYALVGLSALYTIFSCTKLAGRNRP